VISAKVSRKELGKLLRSVREASGVTQEELARRLRMPQANISRLETGVSEGMITTINRYFRALGWKLTLLAEKE
jgi:transcriptional regulator with XRE-family HTH domain